MIAQPSLELDGDLLKARAVPGGHVRDVSRGRQAIVALPYAFGDQELNCFKPLRVTGTVGVEVVEEAARDAAAGLPHRVVRGAVVLPEGDDTGIS